MDLVIRNFKNFMTKTYYNKLRMDKKKPSQRRCYECKELGHYIADCPKLKNKSNEEKKYKEKSKEFKKKYQGRAHIGEEWDSDCNTWLIKGHKPSNHIRARIKSHVYTTE